MDLFGSYHCRGDANPRTTEKTWGIVVKDMNSGAVQLDFVQNYSTNALTMSIRATSGVACGDVLESR